MAWSPDQYLKFEDERTRPARDLLAAVPAANVRRAADLGCGPGNSTELILARFPDAAVVGVDASKKMLDEARARVPGATFELGDIATWEATTALDLIFANASLQWVGGHETLLPRLLKQVARKGSLAIQMPDNLDEPSHVAMRTVAALPRFKDKLERAAAARAKLLTAGGYFELLREEARRVDIWRTVYYHPLGAGAAGIVEWVKGTGLIPFLAPLAPPEREEYIACYKEELEKSYSPLADGTVLLAFPRLFIVATR